MRMNTRFNMTHYILLNLKLKSEIGYDIIISTHKVGIPIMPSNHNTMSAAYLEIVMFEMK